MTCSATYTPPPQVEGRVTVNMPVETAQKLRALLRSCNGDVFDELEEALTQLGRPPLRLVVLGHGEPSTVWEMDSVRAMTINLNNGLTFVPGKD